MSLTMTYPNLSIGTSTSGIVTIDGRFACNVGTPYEGNRRTRRAKRARERRRK